MYRNRFRDVERDGVKEVTQYSSLFQITHCSRTKLETESLGSVVLVNDKCPCSPERAFLSVTTRRPLDDLPVPSFPYCPNG